MRAPLSLELGFAADGGESQMGASLVGEEDRGVDRSLTEVEPWVAAIDGDRGGSGERVK